MRVLTNISNYKNFDSDIAEILHELIKNSVNYLISLNESTNESVYIFEVRKCTEYMTGIEQEWFENWFDTNYYHLLYQSHNDEEAKGFIDQLSSFLNISPNCDVVDIACGRGRHSVFLNEKGYNVTGLDLAERSIEYAKKFENESLHFYCHDKRVVFKKAHFDFAFNLFTSFGYLETKEDLRKALFNMALNLKIGGTFVLDFMNAVKVKSQKLSRDSCILEGVEFLTSKSIKDNKIIKEIQVQKNGMVKKFYEKVHLLELTDFIDFCNYSGLKILHTFGDYQLNAFDASKSDRLILIAKKI